MKMDVHTSIVNGVKWENFSAAFYWKFCNFHQIQSNPFITTSIYVTPRL